MNNTFKTANNLLWKHKARLYNLQNCDNPDKYAHNLIQETFNLGIKHNDALKIILEDILNQIDYYNRIVDHLRKK